VSISVYVPWGLAQGTVLHDTVTISTTSEETTVADNTSTWNTTVWTAWDPNNKLVGPEGDVTPGETLNYTVNYENEGLGIAFGVYITDTLDIDLDDTTLVIGSGGTYNPATRTITWDIGEVGPGEEGSVAFSANVRNDAPLGTIINNFATIYFPSVPQETNTNMVSNMVPIPPANLRTVDYNFGDPEPGFNMDNFPIYRYWMVVKVENAGQGDAFNVKATISSKPDSAMIIDGNVYIGNIPAGGSVWSTDTYTIELDLSQPGPGADQGITWTIEYDDMGGWHHVIEDVPEFPPASPSIAQRPPAWFIVINQPKLYQCYPNPFNPDTWIPYQLSKDSEVTIRIYNISGQLVKMLDLGYQPRGFYISKDKAAYWNGRNEFGEKVSSGVYFYHIQADKFNGIKKMVILK